ncbi:hypothetical protein ABG768_005547 [Culter alburnus]|uniref:Chemokine interleukin-8-like domain-containing protein n=1 Tax=Culter alburnus TaxID=194366 RepID=A0AAW1ZSR7_CULAL
MTLIAYALLAFNLSILLTVQVVESQHVPKTCQCPQTKIKVRGPFSNFTVTPKGPTCLKDEIIFKMYVHRWVYMFCYSLYFSLESYGRGTITLCVSIRKVTKAKDFWNVGKGCKGMARTIKDAYADRSPGKEGGSRQNPRLHLNLKY